jgi:uncharacterized protein YqkB
MEGCKIHTHYELCSAGGGGTLCLLIMPTESYRIDSIHTNVGPYYINKYNFTNVKSFL